MAGIKDRLPETALTKPTVFTDGVSKGAYRLHVSLLHWCEFYSGAGVAQYALPK